MSEHWDQLGLWNAPAHYEVAVTQPSRGMFRRSDPATSQGAAVVALHDAAGLRAQCLSALVRCGAEGATDFELASMVGRQQTSAGKRRLELQRAGLVAALIVDGVQVRRPAPSGTPALVWVAV